MVSTQATYFSLMSGTLRIVSESMRDVGLASREGNVAGDLFKEYEDFCHLILPG
jgi:hypothetical protein